MDCNPTPETHHCPLIEIVGAELSTMPVLVTRLYRAGRPFHLLTIANLRHDAAVHVRSIQRENCERDRPPSCASPVCEVSQRQLTDFFCCSIGFTPLDSKLRNS
jgi:hypothetical protein